MERKLPFTIHNYLLFVLGLLLLALGYWLMSIGPHDSFASRALAPVIVMSSYIAVLPFALLKKFKKNENLLDTEQK